MPIRTANPYKSRKKFRSYIENINLNPSISSQLPAATRSERNNIELFLSSSSPMIIAAILWVIGFIFLFSHKNNIGISFVAVSLLLIIISRCIKAAFSDKTWKKEVLLPTLKIMNPNLNIEEIPENIRKQFNKSYSTTPQSASFKIIPLKQRGEYGVVLPKYSFINKNRVIVFNDNFQLTEIEAIDETYRQNNSESKNEEDIPVFAGYLVKRKLPYHYDGEFAILSTKQGLSETKAIYYNPMILADSNLEPVEVEDMAFNNSHDVYSPKNPNAKLSTLKFLNPIRLNNVFGDTSYLANNHRGYDFWCNIYIKDNMLYAAFNTGISNLFNAWDTPNPEDVAKTYMFILREINEYLNKVIAGK